MSLSVEDLLFLANVENDLRRLPQSMQRLKELIAIKPALDKTERSLFGLVFKASVDPIRNNLRVLTSQLKEENENHAVERCDELTKYITQSQQELKQICSEGIELISEKLLPNAENVQSQVFFQKLLGDLHRYLCEFSEGEEHSQNIEKADQCYSKAISISEALPIVDPVCLGSILNYAVFKYEHIHSIDEAINLLKSTIEGLKTDLTSLSEASKAEAVNVLNVMQNNLVSWTNDDEEEDEEEDA